MDRIGPHHLDASTRPGSCSLDSTRKVHGLPLASGDRRPNTSAHQGTRYAKDEPTEKGSATGISGEGTCRGAQNGTAQTGDPKPDQGPSPEASTGVGDSELKCLHIRQRHPKGGPGDGAIRRPEKEVIAIEALKEKLSFHRCGVDPDTIPGPQVFEPLAETLEGGEGPYYAHEQAHPCETGENCPPRPRCHLLPLRKGPQLPIIRPRTPHTLRIMS